MVRGGLWVFENNVAESMTALCCMIILTTTAVMSWAQSLRPAAPHGLEAGPTSGQWQHADRRTTTALEPLRDGLQLVLRLKPYTFVELPAEWTRDGILRLGPHGTPSIGLLGDEVKAVIPAAARRPLSETFNFWQVDYTRLVPVLIAAIQEQQRQIEQLSSQPERKELEQLRAEIAELRKQLAQLRQELPTAGSSPQSQSEWLKQNIPNPHDGTTIIPYYVPPQIGRAELIVRDLMGRPIRTFELPERDAWGQARLELTMLPSGTYEYSLLFDGRIVATRRMHIVK